MQLPPLPLSLRLLQLNSTRSLELRDALERERERKIVPTRSKSFLVINFHRGIYERRRYNLSSSARVNNRMEKGVEIIRSINRFTNRGATRRNFEFVFGRRKTRKTNGRKRWLKSKIEHRREISSCDSFVIFRARVPSSWRIKIPERSHRPGAYANDFRGKRVRRVRSPICTNTYPEINLYL